MKWAGLEAYPTVLMWVWLTVPAPACLEDRLERSLVRRI